MFSFLRSSLRLYSALAILEPQIYLVVEQFGTENTSLLSGRLVSKSKLFRFKKVKYFQFEIKNN